MKDHYTGITSTNELEAHLSDHGVLFREFRGDGFLVISDDHVFVVKDHEKGDFHFSELDESYVHEVSIRENYPSNRIERSEEATKETTSEPCTEVKLWTNSHTTKFYIAADVHSVSAAFVNFKSEISESD